VVLAKTMVITEIARARMRVEASNSMDWIGERRGVTRSRGGAYSGVGLRSDVDDCRLADPGSEGFWESLRVIGTVAPDRSSDF
jgi:hypothetical protein